MRIGFDAKRLFFNKTGLGVYSRNLVRGLTRYHPNHEYYLFAKHAQKSVFFEEFRNLKVCTSATPLWRTWGQTRDIQATGCKIFHGLSHEIPVGLPKQIRSVVTIHDVIFRKEPELFPMIDRWIYDLKWRHSTSRADRIIAVSEHTKKDIQAIYKVAAEKISVVHPPVEFADGESRSHGSLVEIGLNAPLPAEYFLYVGAITERKNLSGILKAYEHLPAQLRIPLVVVGRGGKYFRDIRKMTSNSKLGRNILFLGQVSNQSLSTIYRNAYALIYPSFYEGFGLPIVESLYHGTPVITSNLSSMPEAAGPGGLLIDPKSTGDIANAMQRILEDSELARKLANDGREYVKRFSTECITAQIEAIYHELI